jgi:MFS family permease
MQTAHATLPYGIRIFAWVRAIRWIGWGLGEALIPVFIIMFSNTFAEAGLFSSSVDIAALLSLPIIGIWADKISAKRLVIWSLLIYPFVGISYFLAGFLGMAIFIVIARVLNGFNYELENIGIQTYYRRMTSSRIISTSFGYIETWSHVSWIAAALVGVGLVIYFPIHYLLLGIAPFAVVAYFVALRAPEDEVRDEDEGEGEKKSRQSVLKIYAVKVSQWRTWSARLWLLGTLVFFSSIVSALMYFFIPIDAYLTGANLPMVVLITVFGAIPALFGYKLGKIADGHNKYSLIAYGLISVAVIAVGLAIFPQYWFKSVAMLLMGIVLELFYVVQNSLITTLGPAETYGERGSAFEGIMTLGDLVAPLILGIGLDLIGFGKVAGVVAVVSLGLAVGYSFLKKITA